MTTPYNEPLQQQQGEWYQFDPNVHYYYDEQGQLHYYDPNTNLECDYQPHYVDSNSYYTNTNTSTPQSTYTHPQQQQQQQPIVSRQTTPDVLLPCPEPTCNGENKPTSKFCEECGRQLGAISRSVTPAIVNTPVANNNNSNVSSLTRSFANHQIQDYQQQHQGYTQPPLQRPPTAPVYSTSPLDSTQTVPLYHPPSVGSTVDNLRQQHQHLYYNGVQHQSMQDLYGQAQQQQQQQQQYQNNYQAPVQQPAVDTLDRARGCPIVCFGFGGKMLVTFPRTVTNYYSSTVKPQPGPIKIKSLKELGHRVFPIQFPGPVLYDSKIGTKQKKKDIAQYMAHMVDEFEKEKLTVVYNSQAYHQLESKILLWQLIKVLVENDGTINDKGKMDQAILSVLRPTITNVEESHFALPAFNDNSNNSQQQPSSVDLSDQVLSKIEHYLLNGDRIGAVDYAIQEDLWAHALIISSCVDKDLWQKVIKNFVDREMNCTPEMRQNRQFNNIAGNNQALRVIYSLFSGAGTTAINEFLANDVQHINTPYGLQAVTPQADLSQLVKWRDTVAIILANRTARDLEALTAFGDMMKEQGWTEAAHIW